MQTRRAHRKSRNGCEECKRRRIKCDEQMPCFNCSRYGATCSLRRGSTKKEMPQNDVRAQSRSKTQASSSSAAEQGLHIVFHDFTSSCVPKEGRFDPNGMFSASHGNSHATTPSAPRQPSEWSADLELMHHYCTFTAETMAQRMDMQYAWRVLFPQEGYSHQFILHGILSLAAMHKAYLLPSRRQHYMKLSAYYQSMGLEKFVPLLSTPPGAKTDEGVEAPSWRAIFCFSSLVVANVCALPALLIDESLHSPIDYTLKLFDAIRGMSAALGARVHSMDRSDLSSFVPAIPIDTPPNSIDQPPVTGGGLVSGIGRIALEYSILPPDTFRALASLRSWLLEALSGDPLVDSEVTEGYGTAVDFLEICAKNMAAAGAYPEITSILLWPFFIASIVRADLEARKPRSLILLAHWAVLFSLFEARCWFLTNWGRLLVRSVSETLLALGEETDQLDWPRKAVYGGS